VREPSDWDRCENRTSEWNGRESAYKNDAQLNCVLHTTYKEVHGVRNVVARLALLRYPHFRILGFGGIARWLMALLLLLVTMLRLLLRMMMLRMATFKGRLWQLIVDLARVGNESVLFHIVSRETLRQLLRERERTDTTLAPDDTNNNPPHRTTPCCFAGFVRCSPCHVSRVSCVGLDFNSVTRNVTEIKDTLSLSLIDFTGHRTRTMN
jgi:hypothetical protein